MNNSDYANKLLEASRRGWYDMEHGVSQHNYPFPENSEEAKHWKRGYDNAFKFWYK